MLLLGACVNISVPWKCLQTTWVEYAQNTEDEENQPSDTEDESRDSKDDREEREAEGFDKDFFGGHACFHFLSITLDSWELTTGSRVIPPHLETFVPPPNLHC